MASPSRVIASPAVVVGAGLLVVAFAIELVRQSGSLPTGAWGDLALLYVQLTLPPTALFVFGIAGLLAPPAPFLVGLLLGLLDASLITLLVVIAPESELQGSSVTELAQGLLPLWIIASAVGAVVTGVVGMVVARLWSRRRALEHEGAQPWPTGVGHGLDTVGSQADSDGPGLHTAVVANRPKTLIRTYRGHQQHDAVAAFQRDAERMASQGYVPVSQSWAPGQWGCGAFLVALVLFLVLIGILIFIYMLLVKPDGTLTVTYQLQSPQASPAAMPTMASPALPPSTASSPLPSSTLADRLAELGQARQAGLISEQEYQTKRADLLRRH